MDSCRGGVSKDRQIVTVVGNRPAPRGMTQWRHATVSWDNLHLIPLAFSTPAPATALANFALYNIRSVRKKDLVDFFTDNSLDVIALTG